MQVVLIGSGNVATHLGKALHNASFHIIQVRSSQMASANLLAQQLNAEPIQDFEKINRTADLYFFCGKDDLLPISIQQMPSVKGLVLHTSGACAMNIFGSKFNNFGVLYPLQTFSKNTAIDFHSVPLIYEANTEVNLKKLRSIAHLLSQNTQHCSSEQRLHIHLAAVFASNFTNHCYAIAENILAQQGLSLDLLKPLIKETAHKIMLNSPQQSQTGPAIRNDNSIIEKHLAELQDKDSYREIYQLFSKSISQT